MTTTGPNQKLSLDDIKAKLKLLKLSIQQQKQNDTGDSDSHSFATPSATHTSGTLTKRSDLTDRNTSNSLHFADTSTMAAELQHADPTKSAHLRQPVNLQLQSQGPLKADSNHDLMTPSSLLLTGSVMKKKADGLDWRSTTSSSSIWPLETNKPTPMAMVQHENFTEALAQNQVLLHGSSSCQSGNTHGDGLMRPPSVRHVGLDLEESADVTNMDVSGTTFTSENTTMTFEMEDHKARMKKIEERGSLPHEWKTYIDFLKTVPCLRERDARYEPLLEAYSTAFNGILNNRDYRDETSVKLIMDFVHFCSDYQEWDTVETILDQTRYHIQKYAVLIVACAEVKIFKGDQEKALTILTKTLGKGKAHPRELLIRAIKSAEAGQTKLLSEKEWKLEAPMILGSQRNPDTYTDEFKVPHPASGFWGSSAKDPANTLSDDISTTDLPQITHPPSASKHSLHHYHSVPEIRSSAVKNPFSKLSSSKLKAIGMPMRVCQSAQQHTTQVSSSEKEDGMKPVHSAKHLYPIHSSTGDHSNMSIPTEELTPAHAESSMQKEALRATGPHRTTGDENKVFPENGDRSIRRRGLYVKPVKHKFSKKFTSSLIEMTNDPGKMSGDHLGSTELPQFTHPPSASKQALHHYHSVPEVRSSAIRKPLFPTSKMKAIGMPARVRQQHAVHLLSSEKEDDTDLLNSIKPLNPLHTSSGRLNSLASSGYQSDMTIPTEDLTPAQPEKSMKKELSQAAGPSTTTTEEHKVLSEHVDRVQPPMPAQQPAAPAAPASWVAPVMSTPSCKGPQMTPALMMQTPSGEALKSVTVNGEQYCILKKAGRGGSAQVYVVLDANTELKALKVVDLEGAGAEVIEGFRNEISLLQRLQYCDSVIKMHNYEMNEKLHCLYLILEYGETDLSGFFEKRAKQQQGLDPTLIKFYWAEMLRAVNALHKEGIIHSDLKPANFLLVRGNLKLIDFGIANSLQQDKTSMIKDSRVGTPSYMSPEAIMAATDEGDEDSSDEKENKNRPHYKVGVRSDVWSLGCILYTMVYGRTPFQSIKNSLAKLQAITNPAYKINFPPIPDPDLMDVLKKCLIREMKLRPTTDQLLAHPYLTQHKEKHRLQEMLAAHLNQGSPRTANAVNRVMHLLQAAEKQ